MSLYWHGTVQLTKYQHFAPFLVLFYEFLLERCSALVSQFEGKLPEGSSSDITTGPEQIHRQTKLMPPANVTAAEEALRERGDNSIAPINCRVSVCCYTCNILKAKIHFLLGKWGRFGWKGVMKLRTWFKLRLRLGLAGMVRVRVTSWLPALWKSSQW